MAALDFPSNPTVGQQYAAPNGVTYQWDGAVWVVTGGPPGQLWTGGAGTLTPTDTTKQVVVPGPTAAGTSQAQLILGTRTAKGRLQALPGSNWYGFLYNAWYDGTAWRADDSAQAVWYAVTGSDTFGIYRGLGTTPGTQAPLLVVGNTGQVSIPGPTATGSDLAQLLLGSATAKGRVAQLLNQNALYLLWNAYYTGSGWVQDNAAQVSWLLQIGSDNFGVNRAPAGGAFGGNLFNIDNAGNLTISGAIGTKASGTTWSNPSDERIKKNIAPYTRGLDAIVALKPKTFEFNGLGGSQDGLAGIGLIAQDVQPVMPEMVSVTSTKLAPDDAAPVDLLMLDTSALVLALVNAVKELDAEVVALKTAAAGPLPTNA